MIRNDEDKVVMHVYKGGMVSIADDNSVINVKQSNESNAVEDTPVSIPKKNRHIPAIFISVVAVLGLALLFCVLIKNDSATLPKSMEYYKENEKLPSLNTCVDGIAYFGKNEAGYLYSVKGGRKDAIGLLDEYTRILQKLGFEVGSFEESELIRCFSCADGAYQIIVDKDEAVVYKDSEIVALIGDAKDEGNQESSQIYVMTDVREEDCFYGKMTYLDYIAEKFPAPEACGLDIIREEDVNDYHRYTLSHGDKTQANNRLSNYLLVIKYFGFTVKEATGEEGFRYYVISDKSGDVTIISVDDDYKNLFIMKDISKATIVHGS